MACFKLLLLFALQWLQVAGVKAIISPSYLWPLRYVYNKRVPAVPPLDIHGDVVNDGASLHFDGKTTWLDAGELTGSCIGQPDKCVNGLSVAMRVKLNDNATLSQSPEFLFDSGGFNGQGVSLYLKEGELYGEVADKNKFWRVTTKLQNGKWHFVLLTWSPQDGALLFVDGPVRSQNSQPISFQLNPVATSDHVIIGKCNAEMGSTFAEFSSDLVALFDSVTPDGKIYLSYSYSAPSSRGNIRYVNTKFINTATFDLIIFPDRGEHQKDGYQLEAHSSTLLEYVLREGPLPVGMNFRLQNKANGEQLKHNGSYDFHVLSSDDKQVIKQYRILQDGTISSSTSTSAVSINYQIRTANVTVEHVGVGGGMPVKAGTSSPEDALKNNPENPVGDDAVANNTSTNTIAPKVGTGVQGANSGANGTQQPRLQTTTTIAPTLPPPPLYTTKAPNVTGINKTKTTPAVKPSQEEGNEAGNPEMPDEGEPLVGANGTNPKIQQVSGMDAELAALFNETEQPGNVTAVNKTATSELNVSSNRTSKGMGNASNGSSAEGSRVSLNKSSPETTITGMNALSNTTTVNNTNASTSSTNTTNTSSTNTTGTGSTSGPDTTIHGNNNTAETSHGPNTSKDGKEVASQSLTHLNDVNMKNKGGKDVATPISNSPNPWLHVAKETQNQQQQPILWQGGQGVYNAIHDKSKAGGVANVKDAKAEELGLGERPVWQFINGPQNNNQFLSANKFKGDANAVSTSPFKFANTKTQEEATSLYNQKKDSKPLKQQTGLTEDDATLYDSF